MLMGKTTKKNLCTTRAIQEYVGYFLIPVFLFLNDISILPTSLEAQTKESLKKLGPAPLFKAIDENNNTVSNGTFLNKYLVVNFFFTSCNGPCPVLMEHVRKLSEEFPNQDLHFISFSVDPNIDSPEKLKNYREQRNLSDPRIHLLHVNKQDLEYLLNDGYKLGTAGEIVNHSTRFVLIDKNGQIRITYSGDYSGLKSLVSSLVSN